MASLHQVIQVNQRFADPQDALAPIAPNFQAVNAEQIGPPVSFAMPIGGAEAFVLIQGYDLNKAGLRVLLDDQKVGSISRGGQSGWSTFILPLPALTAGDHTLQFAPGDAPDSCLIATAIVQWIPGETSPPAPFPADAETVVLRGWVNLDVQRALGGKPDGDTIWLLDAEVATDIRGVGEKVVADRSINTPRDHALGVVKRLKIRFQGVDTPETHFNGVRQNYGFLALKKLEEIGGSKFFGNRSALEVEVYCSVYQDNGSDSILDPHGRVLGYVTIDGLNVNAELVRLGYAFPYLYDSISPALQQRLSEYAQAASTREAGVWREYSPLPVEPLPTAAQSFADYGPINFPTFWRRWVEFRQQGGIPGPDFVTWLRSSGKNKPLAVAPNNATTFADLIDPASNRLLVKPWEVIFKEEA